MYFLKRVFHFFSFVSFFLLAICTASIAQLSVKGRIVDKTDNKPVPNATIKIPKTPQKLSDATGYFEIPLQKVRKADSVTISSVGFKTLKIPVYEAINLSSFFLLEDSKVLENIELKSYSNQASEGTKSEVTGYFRSWETKNTGGEIGRILYVNSDDYKLEKVRFKINNQCDTCIIRLHIRELKNGLPDRDLLQDSISLVTSRLSFDDKFAEFDLTNYNVIIKKNRYIFVGMQTLHCNSRNNGSCSLAYIGTEDGNFLYRYRDFGDWEESTLHSIYMRLFYKY